MPVDEHINEADANARMLADEATDIAVDAAALVELGGELGGDPYRPSAHEPVGEVDGYPEDAAALVKFGGSWAGTLTKGG
jgi:hypothetical protein